MTDKTKIKPATSTGQKHQSIWCNVLWSLDTALTQFLIISLFMLEQRSDIQLLRHCCDSSAGVLGWVLCSNGLLLCNICKGPTALLQGEMNIRVQPVSSANLSAQQAPLWKHSYDAATQHLKHPIQPTINCHFRHLWQTVNTCLSENCTLQAQPMEQYFLSNQWLIRELNKNKGYTIRSPPFHLCSTKMYNSN